MNLVLFPVGTTNIFPIANSVSGGQLLTEYNLRSRESVNTDPKVKYYIGPTFTHDKDDFIVSYSTDSSIALDYISSELTIGPGRGVINGHYFQSLAPVTLDIAEINHRIVAARASGDTNEDLLNGKLCIGLRIMYSTEQTMAGSMLTEKDSDGNVGSYYNGVHVVVQNFDDFVLPTDINTDPRFGVRTNPDEADKITAHILLATCDYYNGAVSSLVNNLDYKTINIPASRIGNLTTALAGAYVTKDGVQEEGLYVLSGRADRGSYWCKSNDSLVVWDSNPQLKPGDPSKDSSIEARFHYNRYSDDVSLILPHKQVDGYTDQAGNSLYYPDKVLKLPVANYNTGSGGVVSREYTNKIKDIETSTKMFTTYLPQGSFKQYIEALSDKSDLPSETSNWNPGDYILVGEDLTVDGTGTDRAPSTMYVVLPGLVTNFQNVPISGSEYATISHHSIIYGDWYNLLEQLLQNIDWVSIINANKDNSSANWSTIINSAIRGLPELSNVDWEDVIQSAIDSVSVENYDWESVIATAFSEGRATFEAYVAELAYSGSTAPSTATLDAYTDGYATSTYDFSVSGSSSTKPNAWDTTTHKLKADVQADLIAYYTRTFWARRISLFLDGVKTADLGTTPGEIFIKQLANSVTSGKIISGTSSPYVSSDAKNRSGIDWNTIIRSHIAKTGKASSVNWESVIASAIVESNTYEESALVSYRSAISKTIPKSLQSGVCLYEMNYVGDGLSNTPDMTTLQTEFVTSKNYRGKVGVDYFRVIVDLTDEMRIYYYVVTQVDTATQLFMDDPIRVTGGMSLATELSIGGFLNVPDNALGNGYVYLDDQGYLRLLDYDILASGTLAYQLGEDYTCSSIDPTELQRELDDYVNNRVVFPSGSSDVSEMSVININITLEESEESTTIDIHGLDSRFGTCAYVHLTGSTNTNTVINIYDCERIRLDIAALGGTPYINLYRCGLYYDKDVLNRITDIDDLQLWYCKFNEDDIDLVVDGLTVSCASAATISTTSDDFWESTVKNDTHFSYSLKSITFDSTGNVVGCQLYFASDFSDTESRSGVSIVNCPFVLTQGYGLAYPERRITSPLKITGSFVQAYPDSDTNPTAYNTAEINFSILTGVYTDTTAINSTISGNVTLMVRREVVEAQTGLDGYPQIDAFRPGKFHLFSGGVVS